MASGNHLTAPPAAEFTCRGRSRIEVAGLTKRYETAAGEIFTALREVTFTVEPGQFCAVVGPTGCGKSTLLNLISGLDRPSAGSVRVGGREVGGITEGVGLMFQRDALMPWKTVLDNVEAGPSFRRVPKVQACVLARDWLRRVGLAGFEDRYPHQLSGGMRKRVAMAATLINEPKILLLDEPFGALDVHTKTVIQTELLGLWEQLRPSVVFITHDLDEAVALSDRVVVMSAGPGTVKATYDIDLARPRGPLREIRYAPRFLEAQQRIWHSLTAPRTATN
jgi:NitT/TauT family transport system ATP-binding protein